MQEAMFGKVKNGFSPDEVTKYIAALAQENERLKTNLNTYETKLREVTALAAYLKQQSESERLRLADVMMQANQTASGIIEQKKQEASGIIANANVEADRIKAAAIEEAAQLKRKLDAELATVRETYEKIAAATEEARQEMLMMFQKVDSSTRSAASLLNIWQQNTSLPAESAAKPPEYAHAMAPGTNAEWLNAMSDLLKNVPAPKKAGEEPHDPYALNH